jgi:hypothetical protein
MDENFVSQFEERTDWGFWKQSIKENIITKETPVEDSLPSALDGGEWSASRRRPLYPRERAPGTHWIRGWVGPRAGLNAVEKRKISCRGREVNSGRLSHIPLLHRLSYPGSWGDSTATHIIPTEHFYCKQNTETLCISCLKYTERAAGVGILACNSVSFCGLL